MSITRENLTRDEAEARASRVTDVRTDVHLDLREGTAADVRGFGSTSTLRFRVTEPGEVFVDCTARTVHEARLDGRVLDEEAVTATRIMLGDLEAGEHELEVHAEMAYGHEGSGLHRFVDPADDRVYLHSQFEPFDAHLVYACFDQPDLKTRFTLTVDAPAEWVVVSNEAATSMPQDGAAGTWRFATTPAISTYITACVAGSYVSVRDRYERADGSGIDLGLYVRRSLAEHLDAPELFEVTTQSFAAFERLFGMRYPFGDQYDQLFVPEFSAGAMENPGCVTFSESYVFRSKVTDAIRERRAETIIHEMAHMWFGDLVTMRWWDDLWLNESFATFMAVHVQASATRWDDAWVTFLDAEKAWAKFQDQLPSTHPVADEMPDVESVHQNFDGITYAKGASVLRQLVAWVGEEAFFAGCRDYFDRHAWGNTTLTDFLGALERASGRDLAAWRDEWLLTTGVNRMATDAEVADDGTYAEVTVTQQAPAPSWAGLPGTREATPILRRHRIAVGVYRATDAGLVRDQRIELDVAGARTAVPELTGVEAGALLLVNDDDLTYTKIALDEASTAAVTESLDRLVDPLARAQVWSATWDMVRDGELSAGNFLALVRGNAHAAGGVGALQRLLLRATGAAERYGDPDARLARLAALAADARAAFERATPGSDDQLAWFRHWVTTASGDPGVADEVAAMLDGAAVPAGIELDTDLRWHLLVAACAAGTRGEDAVLAELERDPTDLGQRHAATARASQPDPAAKQAAWERLLEDHDLSHTMSRHLYAGFTRFGQEQVLAPYTERYLQALPEVWARRSLDWAIGFSTGMFPHAASSPALRDRVDVLLDGDTLGDGPLPRPLRRVLLEQRDTLVRTLTARALDADER
ncbi:MAG: aminopeptidase N [Nitriliruptoraceae bacterium]|nr:aminopeptidase N [Nitriliruptoraceae bacterium]